MARRISASLYEKQLQILPMNETNGDLCHTQKRSQKTILKKFTVHYTKSLLDIISLYSH